MENKKTSTPYVVGLLIVVAIQIAGFALLWNEITSQQQYVYLPTQNNQETKAGTPTNQIVAVTKFPTEAVLHDAIQSALKQELGPYVRQLATAPEAAQKITIADSSNVKENSPENAQTFSRAVSMVEAAIASGEWTNDDLQEIAPQLSNLSDAQRIQIIEKLMNAINNQQLKVHAGMPVF